MNYFTNVMIQRSGNQIFFLFTLFTFVRSIYLLVKPSNMQVLIIICNHGGQDDAMFSADNFNFTGRVGWKKNKNGQHSHIGILLLSKVVCLLFHHFLVSVILDSPITLNSSFITAWYPGEMTEVMSYLPSIDCFYSM